uniref:Uncharacterized protein n=1 Tax=Cacopsylla melanoneura TaxID=428564 RepID=A0A8D8Z4N4_9HEMI
MVQAVFNLLFALNNRPMEEERKSRGYSWDTLSSGNSQKMKQSLPVSTKMSHFIALTEGQTSINLLGKSKSLLFVVLTWDKHQSFLSKVAWSQYAYTYLPNPV